MKKSSFRGGVPTPLSKSRENSTGNARRPPLSSEQGQEAPVGEEGAAQKTMRVVKKTLISKYYTMQRTWQQELKCDYVIVQYKKEAHQQPSHSAQQRSPAAPPSYVPAAPGVPVKLGHHVFMQLAFRILRDRLQRRTEEGPKAATTSSTTSSSSEAESNSSLEGDVVALFMFLWRFASEMNRCAHEAGHTAPKKDFFEFKPVTKQELRFQLLIEYNVDVQAVLTAKPALASPNGVRDYFVQSTKGHEHSLVDAQRQGRSVAGSSAGGGGETADVTEDEFYRQMAKPSGMAQECTIM